MGAGGWGNLQGLYSPWQSKGAEEVLVGRPNPNLVWVSPSENWGVVLLSEDQYSQAEPVKK